MSDSRCVSSHCPQERTEAVKTFSDTAPCSMAQSSRVFFLVLDQVNLLDLAGPAQVFQAAGKFGAQYFLRFCAAAETNVRSSLGLHVGGLGQLTNVRPGPGDLIFIPGVEQCRLD